MAFRPTILFAVANQGTLPRILAVQGPQPIDANVAVANDFTLIGTVSLQNGSGGSLAGSYHEAFTINHTAGTDTGTLEFNHAGFDGLDPILQGRLIEAFATGGRLVLQVEVPPVATPLNLPITLAALRTSDFVVNAAGTTATPAHHPGVSTTTNLAAPSAGTYTFQCPALGAGNLTVSAAGVITVTAAAPPAATFDRPLTIQTQLTTDDGAGVPFALTATSVLDIDLHLPTQCLITLDRSGSMGAVTPSGNPKWAEVVQAANLFSTLYGSAIPQRSTPNGTVLDNAKLRFGRWRWQAGFDIEYQPAAAFEDASTQLQHPTTLTPGGGTPIGQALVDAKNELATGAWRRRHVVLLSDGMDNQGSPTIEAVGTDPATHLPRLSDSASGGVIVHTFSYALDGESDVYNLSSLATSHNGVFLASTPDPQALDPELLRERFLNILAQVVPIELQTNSAGDATFTVDPGVERVIFVAPGAGALSASGPAGDATNAANTVGGLMWASADDPAPGTWTVSGAAATEKIFAILDVSLRMRVEVEPHGLGQPVRLRAHIHNRGTPVKGADVRVALRRPGESIGEVITSFVRRRGLTRATLTRRDPSLLHAELGPMLMAAQPTGQPIAAATVAAGVSTQTGDTQALQRLLLQAAEEARNLPFQYAGHSIALTEGADGVYEGTVPASLTQEEGVYDFHFRAEGLTPSGHAFKRNQRRSSTLEPIPHPASSPSSIAEAPSRNGTLTTVTVFPHSITGRPLGPGMGNVLGFHFANPTDRAKRPPPVTIDNLDGTYSTRIELAKRDALPPVALTFGRPAPDLSNGILVKPSQRVSYVRVTLERLQVLDDKDPCWAGAGELVFDSVVAPNGNPARAVRTRLPPDGVIRAESGKVVFIAKPIYEGWVEEDARLSIGIGGRELDSLLFFRREEKLARYYREVEITRGSRSFTPNDETADPEALRDWKLWYRVEVS